MQLVGIFVGSSRITLIEEEISLSSAHDYVLPGRGRIVAQTDIQIAVPDGCYGRVDKNFDLLFWKEHLSPISAPRSGLAVKSGIDTGGMSSRKDS